MRWTAGWIVPIVGMVWVAGCNDPKNQTDQEKPIAHESVLEPADGLATAPQPTPEPETIVDNPAPQPFNAPPVSQAKPLPEWQYAPANPHQTRVHVVKPKDTLYAIARHYYADEKQWRKILEANRNRIRDPNRIEVGMRLIIP